MLRWSKEKHCWLENANVLIYSKEYGIKKHRTCSQQKLLHDELEGRRLPTDGWRHRLRHGPVVVVATWEIVDTFGSGMSNAGSTKFCIKKEEVDTYTSVVMIPLVQSFSFSLQKIN